MAAIAAIAHAEAGIVIAPGKTSMVQSRLAKRLRALSLQDYASYIALVESAEGAEERRRMISSLTTNVSHFFREAHHFELLREKTLPPLISRLRRGGRARIWSAGCSTGQEAYSIAMTMLDMAPDVATQDFRILATDIDPVVIVTGRTAVFESTACETIPPNLRQKFLEPVPGGMRIAAAARRLVSFRELNLHGAWPMKGRFDAIFCRNVVIYFDAQSQRKLWPRFAAALLPDGWLFVGHSERVPTVPAMGFETVGITTYRLATAKT
ncbi:protein-glutamate O-methyltransferase [Ostreiculturibacter nitratireducens]